jgi:hypothetical protein
MHSATPFPSSRCSFLKQKTNLHAAKDSLISSHYTVQVLCYHAGPKLPPPKKEKITTLLLLNFSPILIPIAITYKKQPPSPHNQGY